jgi:protease I
MKTALILIAQTGFQDKEYDGTRKGLESGGFSIEVGSTDVGECTGKYNGKVEATVAFRDVDVSKYDRIAFIGGPGAHVLKDDRDAQRIAQETVAAGQVLGAICIAPTILATAGVLRGKKATVHDAGGEQAQFLRDHGAEYTGDPVTVDGLIVTGNGPDAVEEFGRVLAGLKAS